MFFGFLASWLFGYLSCLIFGYCDTVSQQCSEFGSHDLIGTSFLPIFSFSLPDAALEFKQRLCHTSYVRWETCILCILVIFVFDKCSLLYSLIHGFIHTVLIDGFPSICPVLVLVLLCHVHALYCSIHCHSYSDSYHPVDCLVVGIVAGVVAVAVDDGDDDPDFLDCPIHLVHDLHTPRKKERKEEYRTGTSIEIDSR